jgi:hypothetical protein
VGKKKWEGESLAVGRISQFNLLWLKYGKAQTLSFQHQELESMGAINGSGNLRGGSKLKRLLS